MTSSIATPADILQLARRTLEIEATAVSQLQDRLDQSFLDAVTLILQCTGRVVVSGMGKSGHIGGKIAATLASTGTPAFFMHPGEASHGDLGMITGQDVVIALSNSGESTEIAAIVPLIKRRGARLIGMTGNPASTLAREADIHLDASVAQEACPHNLAPTASTTAALALGDALAVAVLFARGFTAEDFARTHPGGALGRRLLVHVRDLMHSDAGLPVVGADASLKQALLEMTRKGLGMTAITDHDGRLLGIFTDGDLRRLLDNDVDVRSAMIADVMKRGPRTIAEDALAVEAVQLMEQFKVNGLFAVNAAGQLCGALNMHDLLRAGVV
ncbi:MAG: KpsF/GutQ family sugar-phosphate isomerase [Gammaproteobacteria bacterium]|nr:KpsF/GutQ family sugar-phosphate isomerase [Gammaproteobacteria bacterium]